MAKLKSKTFGNTNKAGEKYEFVSDISVTADGEFRLTIPSELQEIASKLMQSEGQTFAGVTIQMPLKRFVIAGRDLGRCESVISRLVADHTAVESHHELVISYGSITSYAAIRTEDGVFHHTGRDIPDGVKGGWVGTLNINQNVDSAYRVGLFARIYHKTTHTRGSGSKVVYGRQDWNDDRTAPVLPLGPWGEKLNDLIGLTGRDRFNDHGYNRAQRPTLLDMTYTEEAAQFWFEAMMGIARLAHRIESFVGDPTAVQLAIENKSSFLALPSPAPAAPPAPALPAGRVKPARARP